MAEVPIYQKGRAPRTGSPVMAPETSRAPSQIEIPRMGRVQAATSRVNTGRLAAVAADAMEQPKIPLGTFDGERRAGMAWGAAAQQVGGLLGELAEKKARIVQAGAMAEAELEMRSSFAEFQNEIAKNPNQETWLPSWQKRAQALEKSIFGSGRLAPDAEAQMRLRFGQFAGNAEIELSHNATMMEVRRAKQSVQNLVDDHVAGGRFNEAAQAVALGLPQAGATPEEVDGIMMDLARKQRDSDIDGLIKTAPRAAFDLLNETDEAKKPDFMRGLNAVQAVELKDKATASLFSQKRDLIAVATQEIKAGKIATMDQLQEFVGRVDPDAQILDNGDLGHLQAVANGMAPVNKDEDWNQAYSAIKGLDFTGSEANTMKQLAQLEETIGRKFEGPMQNGLLSLLEKRKKAADSYGESDMATIAKLSEDMLKSGEFGAITRDSENLAKKHSAMVIPPTVGSLWWKRPGTAADAEKAEWMAPMQLDDPIKRAAAERKRRESLQALEVWKDSQPQPPTLDQLSKRWNEITGTTRSVGAGASVLQRDANPLLGLPLPAMETPTKQRDMVGEYDRMMSELEARPTR